MTFQDLFDQLCEPFPADLIDWRVGSTSPDKARGMALAYIDARTVMDRFDSVCGPAGWQCNYSPGMSNSIVCNIGIRSPDKQDEWLWKADGAGATDFEGEKGALSDAFKRAAVKWGVGRYLYDLDSPWVGIEQKGRSFTIKEDERQKLDERHDKHAQRVGWGDPSQVAVYRVLLRAAEQFITQPSDAAEFEQKNQGVIANMRVAMRRHFLEQLHRIGAAGAKEAA